MKGNYPQKQDLEDPRADKLGVWIFGAVPTPFSDYYEREQPTLAGIIQDHTRELEKKIREVQGAINSYHTKKVNGKEYWYKGQGDGSWKYVGKEDPRGSLTARRKELEDELKAMPAIVKSCVLGKHGDHYLVDVEAFRKVAGRLPKTVVLVRDLIRAGLSAQEKGSPRGDG